MDKTNPDSLLHNKEHFELMTMVAARFAAEISHSLTPLTANPKVVRESLYGKDHSIELVNAMERAALQIANFCRELAMLARTGPQTRSLIDVNALMEKIVWQTKTMPGAMGRSLQYDLSPDLARVEAAPDEIQIAVEQLCFNGIESLTESGRLLVRTSNVNLDDYTTTAGQVLKSGRYVMISVEDSGCGIPDDIKDWIFEPFVTSKTKTVKRHPGLGLTLVHKIVTSHGGGIDYRTTKGEGSAFTLYFPAVEVQTEPGAESYAAPSLGAERSLMMAGKSKGRVLVVDNERAITDLFKMIISDGVEGCRIETAGSGAEAVQLFGLRHHAVVVLDINMPVMSGEEAFDRMMELCEKNNWEKPGVVFYTGFEPSQRVLEIVENDPAHCLLKKPVMSELLVEMVQQRL